MKIKIISLASIAICLLCGSSANAALIAYWNFNGLAITTASAPGVGGVPTSIAADSGSGTISLSSWAGTVDDFAGSTLNALNSDAAEESLSLVAGGVAEPFPGNNSFITITFAMTGLENPVVSFATRGTATGFDTGVWAWSVNGGAFTDLAGNNTATRSTTFATASVDFSPINNLDGAASVTLRYTLSGSASNVGNNRIDNLQINTIPEPTSALLGALGFIAMLRRRR